MTSGYRGVQCKKMTRVYFSLYQWVPFLFLGFSFFLQLTYLIFKQGLGENSRIKKFSGYPTKDIYQLWFTQDKNGRFVSCVSQSFYAFIYAVIEVCYVVVNVAIFQIYRKIFAHEYISSKTHHVFHTIGMCMVHEKSKDLRMSTSNHHVYLCEMSSHVTYRYCLIIVRLVVSSNMIVLLFGILVSVLRLCQKNFLAERKHLTLNQLELFQRLRSSHVNKFYELDHLMSEQVEMMDHCTLNMSPPKKAACVYNRSEKVSML